MTEIERIEDQLTRAFNGSAWYGDSFSEILNGVTADQAAAQPFPNGLSIWELVLHITFTEEVMCQRIEGNNVLISGSEDFPKPVETSEPAWQETLSASRASHQKLHATLRGLSDDQLNEAVLGHRHSKYFLIQGLIQHLIYHAGQIALVKKFLNHRESWSSARWKSEPPAVAGG